MGFYYDPRQAKMSLEQALEYRQGKDFDDFDTINYFIGNLFLTPVYTEYDDTYEFPWYAIFEDEDLVDDYLDDWDWDFDDDFGDGGPDSDYYNRIEQFDPY